jgi:hypothetical protein
MRTLAGILVAPPVFFPLVAFGFAGLVWLRLP